MIRCLIFDLNDTLVRGLTGVEEALAPILGIDKAEILPALRSDEMLPFLLGETSEDEYLRTVITAHAWPIDLDLLKRLIRANFAHAVPGADELARHLSGRYELALLSDDGREWAAYKEAAHGFLALFARKFYSFDLTSRKNDPRTFRTVLEALGRAPGECLFIDDRQRFLDAALGAGLTGIRFEGSPSLRGRLAEFGVEVLAEGTEIA